jgi:undecaprenyl-diphosphatase
MSIYEIDKTLFINLNNFVGKLPIFDNMIKLVVNEYFIPVTLALIIFYIWFARKKERKVLSVSLLSVGLTALIIIILNQFIVRSRPFEELPAKLLFYKPTDPSFPSNAAVVGFVLATAIFLVNKKLGVFAYILALVYSFSRVYAGVHFPLDVTIGAIFGIFSVLFVYKIRSLVNNLTRLLEKAQTRFKLDIDY